MGDVSPRDRILARRATFVAAALSALPLSAACSKPEEAVGVPADEKKGKPKADAGTEPDADPVPCLSVAIEDSGAPEITPVPCLSPPPFDAGHPKACLSIAPRKPDAGPKVCLGPADPLAPD